jgi:myosin heavy subunit
MSTLSKVFVILVLLIALVSLGVNVTLFAMRVDWKDKFVKELNYHYQTQQIKNAEIADRELQIENMRVYNDILTNKIAMLDVELAGKGSRIADLQRQLDAVDVNTKKLLADVDVYVRQLEVQIAQIQDLNQKADDYRAKLTRASNNQNTAIQELQYARQEAERLSKDLASLEEAHISLARGKKNLEEVIAMLQLRGVDTSNAPPLKALEGRVTACDDSIGMVVISIGKDDGVLEGNEFTVYRNGQFIAKVTINKVDRKWAAGRVTLKKDAPRVSDEVSNTIFISGPNK